MAMRLRYCEGEDQEKRSEMMRAWRVMGCVTARVRVACSEGEDEGKDKVGGWGVLA